MIDTIVEQTLAKFNSIFSETELSKELRKERGINLKKANKSSVKKSVSKNKSKKRDAETLELRAREKALRDLKKELLTIDNVKKVSDQSISKKQTVEDKLKTPAMQNKLEQLTKKNLKVLVKAEKDKNKDEE